MRDPYQLQQELLKYGPWRPDRDFPSIFLTENIITLPKEERKKLERFGKEFKRFLEVCEQIYRQDHLLRKLLSIGKPEWWKEVEKKLLERENRQLPKIWRPDMVLTKDGLKASEVEMAVEGLGFQSVWAEVFELGPISLKEIAKKIDKKFYIGDLSFERKIPESKIIERFLIKEGKIAKLISLEDGFEIEGGYFLRPFNLARWSADLCFCSKEAVSLSTREDLIFLNPTDWFEEKIWLAVLWHKRYEKELKERLGEGLAFLRQMIIPTLILHPDFLEKEEINYLKRLKGKEKNWISKISGFNLKAWGTKSCTLWREILDESWQEFLDSALLEKSCVWVLQPFQKPLNTQVELFNFQRRKFEKKGLKTKIMPFYWEEKLIGVLAMLRNSWKIHGASDTILVAVKL